MLFIPCWLLFSIPLRSLKVNFSTNFPFAGLYWSVSTIWIWKMNDLENLWIPASCVICQPMCKLLCFSLSLNSVLWEFVICSEVLFCRKLHFSFLNFFNLAKMVPRFILPNLVCPKIQMLWIWPPSFLIARLIF